MSFAMSAIFGSTLALSRASSVSWRSLVSRAARSASSRRMSAISRRRRSRSESAERRSRIARMSSRFCVRSPASFLPCSNCLPRNRSFACDIRYETFFSSAYLSALSTSAAFSSWPCSRRRFANSFIFTTRSSNCCCAASWSAACVLPSCAGETDERASASSAAVQRTRRARVMTTSLGGEPPCSGRPRRQALLGAADSAEDLDQEVQVAPRLHALVDLREERRELRRGLLRLREQRGGVGLVVPPGLQRLVDRGGRGDRRAVAEVHDVEQRAEDLRVVDAVGAALLDDPLVERLGEDLVLRRA